MLVAALLAILALATGADGRAESRAAPALRVGLVLSGGIQDPFEGLAYRGLVRAVKRFGVQARVLVAGPKEGALPGISYLARRGYDLVIDVGEIQVADLDVAAREYPSVKFLSVDASIRRLSHSSPNVQGTVFKVEEAAYLAGYLAGLMEIRRPGRDVVSSVGALKIPQVDRFVAGFQAGARAADPRITTLNAYAKSFLDKAKCRAIALRQIARGSGVVFQVADACGLGAFAAARDKGRFGVGVDVDQSGLGPHVMTSVLKRLDLAVFRAIDSLRRGRFRTGVDVVYDLRNGGVALGKISPRVPKALVDALAPVRRQLAAGELPPIPTTLRPSGG